MYRKYSAKFSSSNSSASGVAERTERHSAFSSVRQDSVMALLGTDSGDSMDGDVSSSDENEGRTSPVLFLPDKRAGIYIYTSRTWNIRIPPQFSLMEITLLFLTC